MHTSFDTFFPPKAYTVEPRYKQVGYNKPSYNKVILLVPALYIS